MKELDRHLDEIARTPVLLVGCDFDGTLAPIVEDPSLAHPLRESMVAIRSIASLPHTQMAVISGRALNELARLLGAPPGVHLVGSHGSEFDLAFAESLAPNAAELRDRVRSQLADIASAHPAFHIEEKPASVAFHYRRAPEGDAEHALHAVTTGPALLDGVYTRHGKKVVELAVVPTNKGSALDTLRQRAGATAVVFLGDDITDEDAFLTLKGPDIGIMVGTGDTIAKYRVPGTDDVARILAKLYERRARWVAGAAAVPIEQHALLSDQRTLALVTPDARVVWLCVPRLDSPAIFSELVGGSTAGYFSIVPHDGTKPVRQRYVTSSMSLQTEWRDFSVTDFLDCSSGKHGQRAGRTDLIRLISGSGRIVIEFAPRMDYGRAETRLQARDGGLLILETHDPIVLRSPGVEWTIEVRGPHHTARAEVILDPNQPLALSLCYGTGSLRESSTPPADRLSLSNRFWSSWASKLELPRIEPKLVRRSALTLKALCYGPTGAIAAAGTTSLPEHLGGVRNWDYRFCWLRDAAMSASSLVKLGSHTEGMAFLDWMLTLLRERPPDRLQPLYHVTGEQLGPEAEIAELSGYAGSKPVRVGNAAARQVQLDVFGPVMELISLLIDRDAPLSSEHWRLADAMVQAVDRHWHEPDHGIWEVRRPSRHHVHSRVMCWVTADRAVNIAQRFFDREHTDWMQLRDRIAADILAHGYKKEVNAFTAAYDGTDIDASSLVVGLSGFLPPDDARFIGTVDAVERCLRDGPTVYRYRYDDGLPGTEGGFHICASWLVDAYAMMGRMDDATELFGQLVKLAGPTGLLSEQYDPQSRRALGNHPQAYSHIGLIENAIRLSG